MVRFGLVIGVLALVLAATASIGSAQERVPVPGGVYAGTLTDTTGACSSGPTPALTITISDYGHRIERFTLTQGPFPSATPSQSSFSLYSNVPVAADGSFSEDGLHGHFAGTGVSGSFRFDEGKVLGCAGSFTGQLQPAGPVQQGFAGYIRLIDDGCGGGTFSLTRSVDRLSIVRISVDGFHAGDQVFSGSGTFPEGTVPIDPGSGSFDWAYFPGREPGQEIAVIGTFSAGPQVNGLIAVSPSTCGSAAVTAYPAAGPIDLGPGGKGGGGLPGSGSGASGHGGGLAWWWLLLGVSGVGVASAAFATHRRTTTRSRR